MKKSRLLGLLLAMVLSLGLIVVGCDGSSSDDAEDWVNKNKDKLSTLDRLVGDALDGLGADIGEVGFVNDANVDAALKSLDDVFLNAGFQAELDPLLECLEDFSALEADLSELCVESGDITIECDDEGPVTITITFNDCNWAPERGWAGTITIVEEKDSELISVMIDLVGNPDTLSTYFIYLTTPPNEGIKIKVISEDPMVLRFIGEIANGKECKVDVTVDTETGDWTAEGCGLTGGTYIEEL